MQRIDGVRNSLLVNDHDDFGMERNKILMRHTELLAIGQLQSEGLEPIVQPVSNLFDEHAAKLPPAWSRINLFRVRAAAGGAGRDGRPSGEYHASKAHVSRASALPEQPGGRVASSLRCSIPSGRNVRPQPVIGSFIRIVCQNHGFLFREKNACQVQGLPPLWESGTELPALQIQDHGFGGLASRISTCVRWPGCNETLRNSTH